jgi:hypothetical protein
MARAESIDEQIALGFVSGTALAAPPARKKDSGFSRWICALCAKIQI